MRPPLVILAGGKGTRLRSVTGPDIPKPMVEVYGKPFLYWLLKNYINQGFKDITISTGYKAEVIENYPWPWRMKFERDRVPGDQDPYYNYKSDIWVANGDTWILSDLPEVDYQPTIVTCHDVDAGAQYQGFGKICVFPVLGFYDIGTIDGLEAFKDYFKDHPLRQK